MAEPVAIIATNLVSPFQIFTIQLLTTENLFGFAAYTGIAFLVLFYTLIIRNSLPYGLFKQFLFVVVCAMTLSIMLVMLVLDERLGIGTATVLLLLICMFPVRIWNLFDEIIKIVAKTVARKL